MSTASGLDIEAVDLVAIVGDLQIPCDYSDRSWHRASEPARWVGQLSPCGCGAGGQRLLCNDCVDLLLSADTDEDAFECALCGAVTAPARKAFAKFEPLEKR